MLTQEENETLVRVGAGTPMGELIRRYCVPALLSREPPEPDCPPVHLGQADRAIITLRNLLSDGVKTVADGGDPPGTGTSVRELCAADRVLPKDADWHPEMLAEMHL